MAPNPKNSVHNDPWKTDTYTSLSGPARPRPGGLSTRSGGSASRSPSTAAAGSSAPAPILATARPVPLRPATLEARLQPASVRPPAGRHQPGAQHDRRRLLLPRPPRPGGARAADRQILVYRGRDGRRSRRFRRVAVYDPPPCLQPDERIPSVLPDAGAGCGSSAAPRARSACSTAATGQCRSTVLGEEIENSFAIAQDGVYIVSDTASTSFARGRPLEPRACGAPAIATPAAQARSDQRRLGHDADAPRWPTSAPRRQRPPPTWRSPTTPTR